MKNKAIMERPFEYLRRSGDGQPFPEETVRNWYIARAYVLDKLKDIAFGPGEAGSIHALVSSDSPLMLAVVRQLALSAHFINYRERDIFGNLICKNRTLVTLVSGRGAQEAAAELQKEEYLGNLMQHCKYTVFGETVNADSYLDVELEIVPEAPESFDLGFSEEEALAFVASKAPEEVFSIDTRKAVLAGRVYELGAVIDNLPAEDIHSAKRYMFALDTFQFKLLGKKPAPMINDAKWQKSQLTVKYGLSNIFCADCFESRARGIRKYCDESGVGEHEAWETNNEALSCSEHNRWVAERLILGFRQPGKEERMFYETLYARKKAACVKMLKNNEEDPAHVDLCSCLDLRRSDPDNLKYDSFLLLAIPLILKKLGL